MSNRAWMPLHIGDYLADTGHLTATEHGAYLLLIMHYWQNGCLPENERLISRIARLDADQWTESRDVLAMLFGPNWSHKRIDAELAKADDIIEKRRAAADARHKRSKNDANALHVDSKCSDTGALPVTNNISDASASGASAPADVRTELWSDGVSILKAISGKGETAARSMIGKWLRECRDDCALVLSKIRSAQAERIGEPVSWITAAIRPPDRPPKPKTIGDIFRDDAKRMGLIDDEPTDEASGRMDTGHGSGQGGCSGIARRFAISGDLLGRIG